MDLSTGATTTADDASLPPPQGERHMLAAESELRLEVPHGSSSSSNTTCTIRLVRGSCEVCGAELALNRDYTLVGGNKLALFSWHGCVVDVDCDALDMSYTSDETNANVSHVNTHAQLEALRDEALANSTDGPRVLVVGPTESGKSTLARTLVAYAVKLGRTPLWVDLDPCDNALSVPGTLAVTPMTPSAVTVESFASPGVVSNTTPFVLWYGSTSLEDNIDLYKAQVTALGKTLDARLQTDVDARTSGVVCNTHGWIQNEGYELLLHTIQALQISVVLIIGHDRLYSMMTSHFNKQKQESDGTGEVKAPKIVKLPRSGGVVSRDSAFCRQSRSLVMKRYFYGNYIVKKDEKQQTSIVHQLAPSALHVNVGDLTCYKLSSVALSASLLPVSAKQSTDPVQLQQVTVTEQLQHTLLAVCHPSAVEAYDASGRPSDLYQAGVAGFVVVEKVIMDTDTVHLLSPCAGSLPSHTLLVGDITWME